MDAEKIKLLIMCLGGGVCGASLGAAFVAVVLYAIAAVHGGKSEDEARRKAIEKTMHHGDF